MKTLLNISLQIISRNLDLLTAATYLPLEVKEWLLEFLSSHDQLLTSQSVQLLCDARFVSGLSRLNFYLSEELNDDLLVAVAAHANNLKQISIIHCCNVQDHGVNAIIRNQPKLSKLELRGLKNITEDALEGMNSPYLSSLDLSDCPQISSDGLTAIVEANENSIQRLYLNHCASIDDLAIIAIGAQLNDRLLVLELDFLQSLRDPAAVINFVTENCPNLIQLSLCRYFDTEDSDFLNLECHIQSNALRELDLYGNFLSVLPKLPDTISSLRLSCCGTENVHDLVARLRQLRHLRSVRILLTAREANDQAIRNTNEFLQIIISALGRKITALHIEAYQIFDVTIHQLIEFCVNLNHIALDVVHMNALFLYHLFMADNTQRALRIKSIKMARQPLPYKALFSVGRYGKNLEELEMSHMTCVDDRFLRMLATNCPNIKTVNFNGCRWVTDRGLSVLARNCPLKEVRVRATGVSDAAVYVLAQCCPELEWISHADYSGRPKFSDDALQTLRDSCVQRVIC